MRLHMDHMGEMSVVECQGKIVRGEAAGRLRDAVLSQAGSRVIVLDLSEVYALGGNGLDALIYLQHWAFENDIQLKLFNPSRFVRHRLEQASPLSAFEIASLDQMVALFTRNTTVSAMHS